MSDMNLARRTSAEVSFDGVDITKSMAPYLLSLTYTDSEEDEADDLQIKLQDRDGIWLTSWLEQAINADSAMREAEENGAPFKVTAQSGLCVRAGPGTGYASYGTLAFGTIVMVTKTSGTWSIIQFNGHEGYVLSEYLKSTSQEQLSDMPTIQYGSSGDAVEKLQKGLLELGYKLPRYGADRSFGTETENALKAFQKDSGLTVDGVCGPATWAALEKALGSSDKKSAGKRPGLLISATIVRKNWNSDGKDDVLECGLFELDSVDASGPPSEITIKATSLPYSSQIRQTKKSKAWEAYYLSGIANEIASANNMACMFLSDSDPYYPRTEQFMTSDIAFLSALCHDAGISLKVTNNILVLFDQASYEANASSFTIKKGDRSYTKWKLSTGKAKTHYDSCRVSYTTGDGTLIEGIAKVEDYDDSNESNQQLEIRAKVSSIAEANELAAKMLRMHNKHEKTASFTLPGNPVLVSGITVDLVDWGAWSGKYIIMQARHSVGKSYTVQISLRKVLEGY